MQSFFVIRGIRDKLERYLEDLSKVFVPMLVNGQPAQVQLSIREIKIIEVTYPEATHDIVMRILDPNEAFSYTTVPEEQKTLRKFPKKVDWVVKQLRKFMKLDPIILPKKDPNINQPPLSIYRQSMGVHCIGCKKDLKEKVEFINERI